MFNFVGWCCSRNECFKLDSFYDQEDNNVTTIFDKEVSPFIPALFSGCNSTVFAYGATGSGKTYTMQVHCLICCLFTILLVPPFYPILSFAINYNIISVTKLSNIANIPSTNTHFFASLSFCCKL